MCSERVGNTWSTSGTRRVTLVRNMVVDHECGKEGIVVEINEKILVICDTNNFIAQLFLKDLSNLKNVYWYLNSFSLI